MRTGDLQLEGGGTLLSSLGNFLAQVEHLPARRKADWKKRSGREVGEARLGEESSRLALLLLLLLLNRFSRVRLCVTP